jgi:hypothetical protein
MTLRDQEKWERFLPAGRLTEFEGLRQVFDGLGALALQIKGDTVRDGVR